MAASMFRWTLLWSTLIAIVRSAVNIDEINAITYHVDILNKPVMSSQVPSGSVMHLTSKYGQAYQCNLPEIPGKRDDAKFNEDPSSPTYVPFDIGILLKPLETGPCLVKTKDWWTYEFCYGKHIKQYHLEDNKIVTPAIVLGIYESEYDWKNESKDDETSRNRLQRYHSQYYVNGTKCEVTGTPRRSEVRFLCEEGAGDYISHVNEPESCRYVITVHTTRVCHHPYLRPPPTDKPHPIVCSPVLTATQYEIFQKQEEEDKKLVEEKRKAWLARQEERLSILKQAKQDEMQKVTSARDDGKQNKPISPNPVVESRDGPAIVETATEAVEPDERSEVADDSEGHIRTKLNVISDAVTLFEEIRELSERLRHVDEELESANEPRTKENEDPRTAIGKELVRLKKLSDTLGHLLKQYNRAERDLMHITKVLQNLERKEQQGDRESQTDQSEEVVTQKMGLQMEAATEDKDEDVDAKSSPVRLKVRKITPELLKILKLKQKPRTNNPEEEEEEEEEKDGEEMNVIEQAVMNRLKQSGLDAFGTKVEVKIVTAGYFNDENDNFQMMNEEESDQLQTILIKLLANSDEVTEQLQRQNDLEKNYRFVWDGKKQTTDEDAVDED